ncbi:hypothetical protein DUNSADRAFT_11688 [Dunaliella salina]|uniref:Encoded protein n=1 Tax=Dunaliella salina TaxID=3046 RepID=A0ABQ7H4D2_DUNSA|nr:hypothetical protein DUNSADRAFT_11688 [Dunaliella salina]|eukprot:KAF5841714.1 hypothetical protein DUNSADRAFT_11688 [Dunaliella salina]
MKFIARNNGFQPHGGPPVVTCPPRGHGLPLLGQGQTKKELRSFPVQKLRPGRRGRYVVTLVATLQERIDVVSSKASGFFNWRSFHASEIRDPFPGQKEVVVPLCMCHGVCSIRSLLAWSL